MTSKRLFQHTVFTGPDGQRQATRRLWYRTGASLLAAAAVVGVAATGGRSAPAAPAQVSATATFSVAGGGDDGNCEKGDAGYPPAGGTQVTCSASTSDFLVRRSGSAGYKPVTVGLLRFDTSSLPDNAQISSASLRLYVNAIQNGNGRSLEAEWYAASNWPIDSPDWTLTDSGNAHSGTALSALQLNQYNSLALQSTSNISLTGFTGFRLHISGSGTAPTAENLAQIAGAERGAGTSAQLQVTYSRPSGGFTANEFVNTSAGSSPSRCSPACSYDPTKAFGSFAAACAAASGGDTVGIQSGNYPNQTISKFDCNPSSTVTFVAMTPRGPVLSGLTLGVNNGVPQALPPNNLTFDGLDVNGVINTWFPCLCPPSSNLVIKNTRVHLWNAFQPLVLLSNVNNAQLLNDEIGPACCQGDGIGVAIRDGAGNPQNTTFDGLYVHDIFDSCNAPEAAAWAGQCVGSGYGDGCGSCPHIDGVQVWGGDGITISNSRWYNSGTQAIFFAPAGGGTFSNITLENNMVGKVNNGGNNDVSLSGPGFGIYSGTITIRNNTIQKSLGLYATGDSSTRVFAPSAVVRIINNIVGGYSSGNFGSTCNRTNPDGSAGTIDYSHNLFGNIRCGPTDVQGTPTYVNSNPAAPDLHLKPGSMGIDGGDPLNFTAIDIDRLLRPLGPAPDIGADEQSGSPTAAVVSTVGARRVGKTVLVRWRTGSEVGVVGFNVYRSAGAHRVRLNRVLIFAGGAASGRTYTFRDRLPTASGRLYWLQVIRADGTTRWYGPVRRA